MIGNALGRRRNAVLVRRARAVVNPDIGGGSSVPTTPSVAASFTAANSESLSRADNASLSYSGDWFFAAWVKPTDLTAVRCVAAKDGSGQAEWAVTIALTTGKPTVTAYDTSSGFVQATWGSNLTVSTKHLALGYYDASAKTCHLRVDNGAAVNSAALTNGTVSLSGDGVTVLWTRMTGGNSGSRKAMKTTTIPNETDSRI